MSDGRPSDEFDCWNESLAFLRQVPAVGSATAKLLQDAETIGAAR
jgi:hypothetical protein